MTVMTEKDNSRQKTTTDTDMKGKDKNKIV